MYDEDCKKKVRWSPRGLTIEVPRAVRVTSRKNCGGNSSSRENIIASDIMKKLEMVTTILLFTLMFYASYKKYELQISKLGKEKI